MINEQAANAFKTAKTLTAFYTRLDLARDCITIALDNLPKDFDLEQTKRINQIRNILSGEMSNIWDLREAEERRSCEQPDATPVETFPQFFMSDKWNDDAAFVRFDSKDTLGVLLNDKGQPKKSSTDFHFLELEQWIFWHGWKRITEAEAQARIKTPTPPDEEFPQFYRGSKWLDEDAFVQFDSKDSPCRLFKNDGSWSSNISFKFDEIAENILKYGWVQLTETEAQARIKSNPRIPGPAPAEEQFPPLADPDSLPDPPVLAGPDDNTPNFIQINLPNFF